jgi:hypothetical protein
MINTELLYLVTSRTLRDVCYLVDAREAIADKRLTPAPLVQPGVKRRLESTFHNELLTRELPWKPKLTEKQVGVDTIDWKPKLASCVFFEPYRAG